MYILPWYNLLVFCSGLIIGLLTQNNGKVDWKAWVAPNGMNSYIVFCAGGLQRTLSIKILLLHTGIVEIITSVSLLAMFSRGLYKIYHTQLTNHTSEFRGLQESVSSTDVVEKRSIQRVIKLRNIMKKQTILVCIALGTSILYWLVSVWWSPISTQSGWDIIVNSLCTWLMFGCAEKYWNWISRYICCHLCYRDINHLKGDQHVIREYYVQLSNKL